MKSKKTIYDVFKTQGQPQITYVKRKDGDFEKRLSQALDNKGTLCLLTGPSKTGKTTLYTHVLNERNQEPLIIRCSNSLKQEEFWRQALEKVDFERIKEHQKGMKRETKLRGKIGWNWLIGLTAETDIACNSGKNETESREKILAEPNPCHIIPILKNSQYILVVEDFHYLNEQTQLSIFQQWKIFIDSEISVIVIGTTHHASDLAFANKDLVGRISQINISTWETDDLGKICTQGFQHIKVSLERSLKNIIAKESVGLPIITQSVCLELLIDKDIKVLEGIKYGEIVFKKHDIFSALHGVAKNKYTQFEAIYDKLKEGPRKKARKYETYELILAAFSLDPLKFSLSKDEIVERLKEMPIAEKAKPPIPSINSTMNALKDFQKRNGLILLEWHSRSKSLYILEPAFLFYLRWRKEREKVPTLFEVLTNLMQTANALTNWLVSPKND